jgi:hypothetical protein
MFLLFSNYTNVHVRIILCEKYTIAIISLVIDATIHHQYTVISVDTCCL